MCGRFAVGDTDGTDWADWLALDPEVGWPEEPLPTGRWNIAPTQHITLVHNQNGKRRAEVARWGLIPHWWKKPLSEFRATTFNARSEEAAGKPMFRDAWKRRRCLIPAIGWYEWTGKTGAKTPYFITLRRNAPGFWFAGLWADTTVEGERLVSATILTTAAGEATRHLHPRSPVVLEPAEADRWLDPEIDPTADRATLMTPPADDRIDLWEVGRAVGQVRNEGPELVERVGLGI